MSQPNQTAPMLSRLRFAGFILLAIYPIVTVMLYGVFEVTPGWPLWLRTLIMCPIIVVTMVWGIIPGIHKYLKRFVFVNH